MRNQLILRQAGAEATELVTPVESYDKLIPKARMSRMLGMVRKMVVTLQRTLVVVMMKTSPEMMRSRRMQLIMMWTLEVVRRKADFIWWCCLDSSFVWIFERPPG